MEYFAHIDNESGRRQTVLEHLTETARLAGGFAQSFGAADEAYRCGMLHDIGKYSNAFQRRIMGSTERVDHSSAGAIEAFAVRDFAAAFCVAGHHGGMPDRGGNGSLEPQTLLGRVKRKPGRDIEDYSAYLSEVKAISATPPRFALSDPWSAFFYTHMLFSCLVDADWLDTEDFMKNGTVKRGTGEDFPTLSDKLDRYVSKWWGAKDGINARRCRILRAMMDAGALAPGLYTLTVPTGGGKTVSSMAFSLRHAIQHGQNRIIYVIPYTSIIEQTQDNFENIFGAENVVAHYADVSYRNDENGNPSDQDRRRHLASENWDAPIILTTAVQFFESLFSNRPSKCRKLHNIAKSVIVFDEAQMLPAHVLRPCVAAITELTKNYGCTAVLCTATQPALEPLIEKRIHVRPTELCPEVKENFEAFRRVQYHYEGTLTDEELAGRLQAEAQVLCIVNSRAQAQKIYKLLPEADSFHLSTAMTAEHRRTVLEQIRLRLAAKRPCRVVSTSLIEAGVDVDFPTTYRAVAGLDSMIQAAGRCNREGKIAGAGGVAHIFDTETKPPKGLEQSIAAARHTMRDYEDIASPEAIKAYFDFLLYGLKGDAALDEKEILSFAEKDMAFDTVAKRFHLIENAGRTVYIPRGEGKLLTQALRQNGPSRELLRKLGQYAVTVYDRDYDRLYDTGVVEPVSENAAILLDIREYSETTGLNFSPDGGRALFT